VPAAITVVELRQYLLRPGCREELIELFDREFIETQEQTGMVVIGQFRDVDRPDYFVWLRGFDGMQGRRDALTRFYGGPVWAAHRDAANATMIDSDDVLLMRPLPIAGRALTIPSRPLTGGNVGAGAYAAIIWHRDIADTPERTNRVVAHVLPQFSRAGLTVIGMFETEPAANTYPALPVREGVDVLMVLAAAPDLEQLDAALAAATKAAADQGGLPSDVLRLLPTARSRLQAPPAPTDWPTVRNSESAC
jgi:hypothetical protein